MLQGKKTPLVSLLKYINRSELIKTFHTEEITEPVRPYKKRLPEAARTSTP